MTPNGIFICTPSILFLIHQFTYSLIQYLLSTYFVPGYVRGVGYTMVTKKDMDLKA